MELATFPSRPAYDIGQRAMNVERGPRGEDFAKQILGTVGDDLPKPVPELDVLDIGSGYGHTALALAKMCRSVVCIEPCSDLVQEARLMSAQAKIENIAFHHATLDNCQTDRQFDLIVLDNVLEHLPDQAKALSLIVQLLRPGGVFYLVVPNKWWPIEVHYHLPFLGWLPLDLANAYLRWTGKGNDYADASYAPGFVKMIRLMNRHREWTWRLALPANLAWTTAGAAWHYRIGVRLLKACPWLWAFSKAFLVVAKKKGRCP
jgi:SAM-dependent methyltransferase